MVDQEEFHKQCLSDDPKERTEALDQLRNNFSLLPDKQQAWYDLIRMTDDRDWNVRSQAANALVSAFSYVPDKQQAWKDLVVILKNASSNVVTKVASVINSVYPQVPDKQQAWNDLIIMTNRENESNVRFRAVSVLIDVFSKVPDKKQAWNNLIKFISDKDWNIRFFAVSALDFAFSKMTDKQQAWNDIHILTISGDSYVKSGAAIALGSGFSHVPDKLQAWSDLHRLTTNQDSIARYGAASALGSAFPHLPNKQQAWNDLHRLTTDRESFVRSGTASVLGFTFSYLSDKQQAWSDLHRLINDENSDVRYEAVSALGSSFSHIPDKQQAWSDLSRLINDENSDMRSSVAYALGNAFPHLPDKQQAWNSLHGLVNDVDWNVRYWVTKAIGFAFSEMAEKQQAWNDLHRLIDDQESDVRYCVAKVIGSTYSSIPDKNKQQALNDLYKLTNDQDSNVRAYANHYLGRISIFKASQAEKEQDYKNELENAIEFFEKAAEESFCYDWKNPSQFCLPFYLSFHTILFKKGEAKEEVDKYMAEAKFAIEGSKSKELLLEAIVNLANALKEVHISEDLDLETKKSDLHLYREYCDRATELMVDAEEKAPFAVKTMRKGLPILNRNLKEIIEKIQDKAKIACQVSQGTPTQEIACAVNREVQKWEISSQEEISLYIPNIVLVLKSKIPHIPENKQILGMIESMKYEKDLSRFLYHLSTVIGLIPNVNVVPVEPVLEKIEGSQRKVLQEIRKVGEKFDDVKISLEPGISEELILHLGYITSAGGVEYTLTIPFQEFSCSDIKEELKEITGKRIDQMSMLPKKIAKIVEDYLVKNKMEDLLQKLR